MSNSIVGYDVQSLINQWMEQEQKGVRFPVPFDVAWQIAGYSRKDSAKRKLPKHALGKLYHICRENDTMGRPEDSVYLSIQGFVAFLVNSNNAQSKNLILQIMSRLTGIAFGSVDCDEPDKSGFVYLVRQSANSYYKIGKSRKPYARLQTLQTGSPLELVIIERYFSMDCAKLESALHDYYSAYWVRGEWFDFTDEVVAEFLSVVRQLDGQIEYQAINIDKPEEAIAVVYGNRRQRLIGE